MNPANYDTLNAPSDTQCLAFEGNALLIAGKLRDIAPTIQSALNQQRLDSPAIIVFDAKTSRIIEIENYGKDDIRHGQINGDAAAPKKSDSEDAAAQKPRGRGRPRLGVVPREVTLLPRHWDWLNAQPGGASVALRKLVEQARQSGTERDARRASQEACYKFMVTMAGNCADFEEANRALFANDPDKFQRCTETWPTDIREHARTLAAGACRLIEKE